MKNPLEKLLARKAKLEEQLAKENERTTKVFANVGWGAGMRKTKIGPSFAKTEEIQAKLNSVNDLIEAFQPAQYGT